MQNPSDTATTGARRWRRRLAAALLGLCCALPALADGFHEAMPCGADGARPDRATPQPAAATVRTDAGTIGYYRFGHGSPLLLITGLGANMAEWNAYFLGELARHHEVILFDNRGIGSSNAPAERQSIGTLAADGAALLAALDLRNVTVIGWSMGGAIAQRLALDDTAGPRRVARLVLLNTLPPGRGRPALTPAVSNVLTGSGPDHFAAVMRVLFPADAVGDAERCFVRDMFLPAGYRAEVTDAVTRAQQQALAAWTHDKGTRQALGKLKLPTLVIGGVDDKVLPAVDSTTLAREIGHAELLLVDDGGHALMYQYPVSLARRIDAFAGN